MQARRTRLLGSFLLLASTSLAFAPTTRVASVASIGRRTRQQWLGPQKDDVPEVDTSVFQLPFGVPSLDKNDKRRIAQKNNASLNSSSSFFWMSSFDSTAIAEQLQTKVAQPVERMLDGLTGGWALSYADLSPDSTSTPVGQGFLATNAAYFVAGVLIMMSGDAWLGFWTDMAAICSFNYHYNQLLATEQGNIPKNQAVRMALLLDYTAAGISLLTGTLYLTTGTVPMEGLVAAGASLVFLSMSWAYEYGRPYMFWHSLWHLSSAYAGYVIGVSHAVLL